MLPPCPILSLAFVDISSIPFRLYYYYYNTYMLYTSLYVHKMTHFLLSQLAQRTLRRRHGIYFCDAYYMPVFSLYCFAAVVVSGHSDERFCLSLILFLTLLLLVHHYYYYY